MEYRQIVTPPVRWGPEREGEFLEGIFEGIDKTDGPHGPYERFLIRVHDRVYWIANSSLREAYRDLQPRFARKGCAWKVVCILIDDHSLPGKRAVYFRLHAGEAPCHVPSL